MDEIHLSLEEQDSLDIQVDDTYFIFPTGDANLPEMVRQLLDTGAYDA